MSVLKIGVLLKMGANVGANVGTLRTRWWFKRLMRENMRCLGRGVWLLKVLLSSMNELHSDDLGKYHSITQPGLVPGLSYGNDRSTAAGPRGTIWYALWRRVTIL